MNRDIFAYVFSLMLFFCIAVPLAQPNEKEPATTFVTKVKGLGFVLSAFQTPDGYVSISRIGRGDTYKSDIVILRESSNSGQRILEKELSTIASKYRSRDHGHITGLAQTVDGYVFVGSQGSFSYYDHIFYSRHHGFLFKLNRNAKFEWSKNFDNDNAFQTFFDSVISKPDGGFVVIGRQYSPFGILLVSFTSNGDILWKKRIKNFLMNTYHSQRVSDGIILASGTRILKINDSGNIVWKKNLNIKDLRISSLGHTPRDNGVVIAGDLRFPTQLLLMHLEANGNVEWTETYSLNVGAIVSTLLPVSDGYVIGGKTLNKGGDGMLFKINAKRDVVWQMSFGGPGNQNVHSIFTRNGGYALIGSNSKDMLISPLSSNGIVPGCTKVNSLKITKVASPQVASENLGIVIQEPSLSTSDLYLIGVNIADSQSTAVSTCQ